MKNIIYSKKIRKSLAESAFSFEGNLGKTGIIIDAESFASNQELTTLYNFIGTKEGCPKIVVCGTPDKISEDIDAVILDPKEVSVSGNFKAEEIRSFSKEPFDFLICYFSKKNRVGSLLAAESQVKFKIGNSPDEYGIYDVEVKANTMNVFQQEVLKYLKILKKNN
ncbi:DUF6913 domain-containing protein [Christiangramia forsetii]|uniref:DUF6913 domain-containing protein n=1 Tax=Christiangramia forsetii TaxID=411153 RepID=UPI0011D1A84E|nr:hypothetical protein [Christiangramia forsetii]